MKVTNFKRILNLVICVILFSVFTLTINAGNYTKNVDLISDVYTDQLWDGVTQQRMAIESKRVGSTSGEQAIYKWDTIAISAENNPAIRIVTWGIDTQLSGKDYKAGTTLQIAKDYEKQHPGYTVIAGVNGDFFANRGFTTSSGKNVASATNEPLNTWIADGESFKSVVMANQDHIVLGFKEDRSYTYHIGSIYGKDYEQVYSDNIYDGTGAVRGENIPEFTTTPVFNVGDVKKEANVYRQTGTLNPDAINIFWQGSYTDIDVTGYTVWKGYTDRLSIPNDGFNKTFIGRHPSDSSQNAMAYNLDYTHYYLRGRLLEEVAIDTISTVEENWFYVVTKDVDALNEFAKAVTVNVQYELAGAWEDVTSTMGVLFPFLINGKRTGYVSVKGQEHNNNYLNDNKPKPAVGFKADGTCVFFFMGPGPLSGATQGGPSSVEMTEVMEEMGIVDAFCLDGGGSASIVSRNKNGELVELNSPTDPGGTRSVANAILMVVENSNLGLKETKDTSATFHQSAPMADSTLLSATLHINNKTYEYDGNEILVEGLSPDTEYSYYFEYTYQDEHAVRTTKTNELKFKTNIKAVDEDPDNGNPDDKLPDEILPGDPVPDEDEKPNGNTGGGMSCSFGVVTILPMLAGAVVLLIKKNRN